MIFLDIEASGTNYAKNSIVSLGAVSSTDPTRRFYGECRIWDGAHINEEAMQVNGFTEAEITDPVKMSETELVVSFFEWLAPYEDWTLAGQNVSFDRDFLRAVVDRGNLPYDIANRTIDVHTVAYAHMTFHGLVPPLNPEKRRSALNLDAVLLYCGIAEEPQPHNALTGALSHAEVLSRMLWGKAVHPEFAQFPIPDPFVLPDLSQMKRRPYEANPGVVG